MLVGCKSDLDIDFNYLHFQVSRTLSFNFRRLSTSEKAAIVSLGVGGYEFKITPDCSHDKLAGHALRWVELESRQLIFWFL